MKNCTEYRQNLKPLILEEAEKRFCECGVKSVKMDDIAKGLRISKRTIYELYSNKEELLLSVIKNSQEKHNAHMAEFYKNRENVMDVLLEELRIKMEKSINLHPDFLFDVNNYPSAKEMMSRFALENLERSIDFFKQGVEEGYFISTIDYTIFTKIIYSIIDEKVGSIKDNSRFTYKEIFRNYILVMTRGICTTKGIERIDSFFH